MAPRAPRICGHVGCAELIHDGESCPVHPHNWKSNGPNRSDTKARRKMKKDVLKAAQYRCEIGYVGTCTGVATTVDRIDNSGGYSSDNTQASCRSCNQRKGSIEGNRAQGYNVTEPARLSEPPMMPRPAKPSAPKAIGIPRRIVTRF